jgi:hypothetical protein
MGELIPFRRPNNNQHEASVKLNQGLLFDFLEAQKVSMGTHRGHAVCDSDGNILRVIALSDGEIPSQDTINELLTHYSSPDNPATYNQDPSPDDIKSYWLEAGSDLDI